MRKRILGVLATAAAFAGVVGAAATPASAVAADFGPATAPQTQSVGIQGGIVETWIHGNIRYGPSTDYAIHYTEGAGFVSYGLCWKYGGWVNANGISHNKWVKLSDREWIWGGLLKGDETGGVRNYCS
ncbi:hypothetical protein F0L17_26570 [Streptomyces sp. TRM43335]|uniref:SH3 domain-containing protein n=1 Tax=Streptomyces taklimakanensis TaxID=2569853 RepID=A0A6G2BJY2_9ACTN|nr:hypothetical protein [Streptomyces taklimakanensis]MTE22595.1 hypothetical protein [Streptomyces taklimakanensis]